MLDTWRVKKTGEIVYPMGATNNAGYTLVLFPFKSPSRKGNRGDLRSVRSDNLIQDKDR